MKLFQTEILPADREDHGSARLINDALHAVQKAYLEAISTNKQATVKITVEAHDAD